MEARSLIFTLVVALPASACTPGDSGTAVTEPAVVQLMPVPGGPVLIPVAVDGEEYRFLLDLSAGQTLIDQELADRLGCQPRGRGMVYRAEDVQFTFTYCPGVTLSIGGADFPREEIGVTNIDKLWPPGLPPINGVLALDVFRDQPITLALGQAELTLESDRSLARRTGQMNQLNGRVATGIDGRSVLALTEVFVNGERGFFLLDNNQLLPVFVDEHILPPPAGAATGKQVIQFKVTGMEEFPSFGVSKQLIYDGVMNEEILRSWELTLDLKNGNFWAKRLPKKRKGG